LTDEFVITRLFQGNPAEIVDGVVISSSARGKENQDHTNDAFSEKWQKKDQRQDDSDDPLKQFQFKWYLTL